MSKLANLVNVSCGAGAGAAIIECMRALRLARQYDACDILAKEYDRIRAAATKDGAEHGMTHAGMAEADIISDAMRLPKTWPFPTNAEEALV